MSEFNRNLTNNHYFNGKLKTEIKIEIIDVKEEGLSEEEIFDDEVLLGDAIPSVALNDLGQIVYIEPINLENDSPIFSADFTKNETVSLKEDVNRDISDNPNTESNKTCIEFQCAKCLLDFSDSEKLAEHVKTIHGNETPKLRGIDENNLKLLKFGVEDNLLQVSKSLSEEAVYECQNCLLVFKANSLTESKIQKKVTCIRCESELCKMSTKKKSKFKIPSEKDLRKCSICSKSFNYKTWHAHMREVHGHGCFICNYCNKLFKVRRYLRIHIINTHRKKTQIKKKLGRFKCSECPKVFDNKQSRHLHIRNCHGQNSQCSICGANFKSLLYLRTHMQRVHYDDGKKHKCPICGKEFKAPRRVTIHIKNCHTQSQSKCSKCDNMFCKAYIKAHEKKCTQF